MEEFSFDRLDNLLFEGQKEYIQKYFVPLTISKHAVWINGKYDIQLPSEVKHTYFNRMDDKLSKFYFKEYKKIKSIVYKLTEPIKDNELNLCPSFKHAYQPYSSFSDETKVGVEIMLSYVQEVLCSNNMASYQFLLKWIANMIKGNKNNSCLYFRGRQGLGKSTLWIFIQKHVIGILLTCETGSEPIRSRFNDILGGKLLVMFEELETFSKNEWMAISSNLKRIITSTRIRIETKNQSAYEANNLNNYVLLTNNDAIKDDDGRRYFILDISTSRIGDEAYWDNIYSKCFNDEVGKAFYCYFREIDTTGFNPQSFPITQSKLDAFAKRLESSHQFIKDKFILTNQNMYLSVDELFKMYEGYCEIHKIKAKGKINFNRDLNDYNIKYLDKPKKIDGKVYNMYDIKHSYLLEIANKNHWLHHLDPVETDDTSESNLKRISELEDENVALKHKIMELETKLTHQNKVAMADKMKFKSLIAFK